MANISIRGLDAGTLAELKRRAAAERRSVNALVVELLHGGGRAAKSPALRAHDDLDALAGTWTERERRTFERHTRPFEEVDPALWK